MWLKREEKAGRWVCLQVKGLSTGHPLTWGQAQRTPREGLFSGGRELVVPGRTQKKAEQLGVELDIRSYGEQRRHVSLHSAAHVTAASEQEERADGSGILAANWNIQLPKPPVNSAERLGCQMPMARRGFRYVKVAWDSHTANIEDEGWNERQIGSSNAE
ncbi:hypothetical protein EYF80_010510 [Liparis tanakae]|uniref:Uncharacterized protein n=1 Tax=Liparis tanakae TaxID=230148 RepID=A0A4Z2IN25_9TELE|nr:hypothetical protein EYF80_010510 [Liparis tanakae]